MCQKTHIATFRVSVKDRLCRFEAMKVRVFEVQWSQGNKFLLTNIFFGYTSMLITCKSASVCVFLMIIFYLLIKISCPIKLPLCFHPSIKKTHISMFRSSVNASLCRFDASEGASFEVKWSQGNKFLLTITGPYHEIVQWFNIPMKTFQKKQYHL